MTEEFNKFSYRKHKEHHDKNFDSLKMSSWENKNTVDYWRHERMYTNLDPIVGADNKSSWLTVGDGRYGTDANYLMSKGAAEVHATDISETYLKIAYESGFIKSYSTENAEELSFSDNAFDYLLCKEAYHHFPRPMVALYEMIRVARKAVILIEPQDANILIPSRFNISAALYWIRQTLINKIKVKIGRELYYHHGNYEEVGNYVYTISEREIEKVALGLNFGMISFKGLNDSYINGAEFEELSRSLELFNQIKANIRKADKRVKKGLQPYGLLIAIIHKSQPDVQLLQKLEDKGFDNRVLPRNPYG